MKKEEIKALIVKANTSPEELKNAVNAIWKELQGAYGKGYKQGKHDPEFDNED